LTLYTRPDSESRILAQISSPEAIDTAEYGYIVGRMLWAEVEVISHSYCESDKPPTIKARGWIRAHDGIGAPTSWFPSRGR
jgi:hypothetical protein